MHDKVKALFSEQMQDNEDYQKMVDSLKEKVLHDGCFFYNHLADKSVNKPNKWHPIHIKKSLSDVLKGTVEKREQEEVVIKEVKQLLSLVLEDESFLKLREAFSE